MKNSYKENFEISSYSFKSKKIKKQVTIAAVSDIHNNYSAKWIDAIKGIDPHYIFVMGDLVYGKMLEGSNVSILWKEINPSACYFLKELQDIAQVYLSIGNHEIFLTKRDVVDIKKMGVIVLDNEYVFLDEGIVLGGLTSGLVTCYKRYEESVGYEKARGDLHYLFYNHGESDYELTKPESSWLDKYESEDGYKILLSHHPEYWVLREPRLAEKAIDLVVSGHAHGGQIMICNRGIYSPGQGLWPRYIKGQFDGKTGTLVVCTGLANTYSVPRIFNPFEMLKIEIVPQ